ncbi:MAG: DUF1501 domain-containing protein [Gemmataceae bacterium]|nr:DUF1501 domain-containing protein [Gemmataceae bacterium]MDW8266128.1 DUF1501 domain-containing protein [Gemmataceae bacterium]
MFRLETTGQRLCDGLTRREMLRIGGIGTLGLSWPTLLRAARGPATGDRTFGKAKACIFLFLTGGPPQHETWDPKPDAPSEIRGDLKPIPSVVPGLYVGELMPRTARVADKCCVLRAVSTNDNAHSSSGYWMLTGYPHVPTNVENAKPGPPNDHPTLGAVIRKLRRPRGLLPAAVTLPEHLWNTGGIPWPGQDAGFLGRSANPWLLHCDPNEPNFQIAGLSLSSELPPLRLQQRQSLWAQINRHFDSLSRQGALLPHDALMQQAFDLLRSPQARQAFDLEREPPKLRDRYGRHRFGQSVLLARRLVEAGVSLVQVNWTRDKDNDDSSPMWDTHRKNEYYLRQKLMPPFDAAYSALLEDLSDRGLLDETLVVLAGEFGRTPRINKNGGRDHWGHVFSVALAGGGVRGGQVLGASDAIGGQPRDGRVQPQDLAATIFHCLGLPPDTELHDTLGRPIPFSRGEVIHRVFG